MTQHNCVFSSKLFLWSYFYSFRKLCTTMLFLLLIKKGAKWFICQASRYHLSLIYCWSFTGCPCDPVTYTNTLVQTYLKLWRLFYIILNWSNKIFLFIIFNWSCCSYCDILCICIVVCLSVFLLFQNKHVFFIYIF